ncbi:MAG TPA: DUF1080 domain-containing protein [Chitinophagaceae bacterium]|nr:DUF1080 domain-containing protein [Chitinophagaceae bacterium]
MKYIFITAGIACSLFACQSETKTETANADTGATKTMAVKDTAWISLFDGSTTNGWHSYGQAKAGGAWTVDSGTLHLNSTQKEEWHSKGGGDLVTNDVFDNFDFKIEWKISKAGNSGILFYVQEDTAKYKYTFWTGPEMQVLDDERHDDRKTPSHRAGSLYDMIQATPGAVKPAGEWNEAEIVSNNGKLDFYLNGVHVVNTTIWDSTWKQMVAKSKFTEWPEFGTFKSGHFALQDHGNDVWYRNIRIRKL